MMCPTPTTPCQVKRSHIDIIMNLLKKSNLSLDYVGYLLNPVDCFFMDPLYYLLNLMRQPR